MRLAEHVDHRGVYWWGCVFNCHEFSRRPAPGSLRMSRQSPVAG